MCSIGWLVHAAEWAKSIKCSNTICEWHFSVGFLVRTLNRASIRWTPIEYIFTKFGKSNPKLFVFIFCFCCREMVKDELSVAEWWIHDITHLLCMTNFNCLFVLAFECNCRCGTRTNTRQFSQLYALRFPTFKWAWPIYLNLCSLYTTLCVWNENWPHSKRHRTADDEQPKKTTHKTEWPKRLIFLGLAFSLCLSLSFI